MNVKPVITIAIVDDHAVVRNGIASMLTVYPQISTTIIAEDGAVFIEMLKKAKRPPDVCLLDVSMPNMDGYETAAYLRKHWPGIKTLALSMYDDETVVINMLAKGARGFLFKDTETEVLVDAIQFVYEHGYYYEGVVKKYLPNGISDFKNQLPHITEKEMAFLQYCCSDLSYKEIAIKMGISTRTVESYADNLFAKLNVHSRVGLTMYAIKAGLVVNTQVRS